MYPKKYCPKINPMRFLLDDGLEGGSGGVVQPHDVPGEGQHLPPVVLGDLSPDLLLHTRLEFVTAEEVDSDQEVQQVRK